MKFGLQKVKWYDDELKAEVCNDNWEVIRVIQYASRMEYNACKQIYELRGVPNANQ